MAQLQIAAHASAAQVKIAVAHAQVIASVGIVLDGERGHIRAVQNLQVGCYYFNVACGEVGILACTLGHLAGNLYHEFTSELRGCFMQGRVSIGVKYYLGYSVAVTHINKCHAAHFAGTLYPSGQSHCASGIGKTQFAACISSKHSVNKLFSVANLQNYSSSPKKFSLSLIS